MCSCTGDFQQQADQAVVYEPSYYPSLKDRVNVCTAQAAVVCTFQMIAKNFFNDFAC